MCTGITQTHCGKCLNQYFWVFFTSSVSVFKLTWLYNYEMQITLSPEPEIEIQENWSSTGKEQRKVNYKTHGVEGRYQQQTLFGGGVKPIPSRFQPGAHSCKARAFVKGSLLSLYHPCFSLQDL